MFENPSNSLTEISEILLFRISRLGKTNSGLHSNLCINNSFFWAGNSYFKIYIKKRFFNISRYFISEKNLGRTIELGSKRLTTAYL